MESDRSDVLAEVPGVDCKTQRFQETEQFAWNQMDLAEVGRLRTAARQVAVPHNASIMGIAIDASAGRQSDRLPRCLAEAMPAVDGYRDHRPR